MPAADCALRLIPRYGGHDGSDWYPWFRATFPEARTMPPVPKSATPRDWRDAVDEFLPSSAQELQKTVVVTHSLAMHGLLQTLSHRASRHTLLGTVLVAAWWDIDRAFWDRVGEPWDAIAPWLDYPANWAVVRQQLGNATALIGDDDPVAASPAAVTADLLKRRLECAVRVCPGRGHFNRTEEPDVAATVSELIGLA